jgi:hypothetical protein
MIEKFNKLILIFLFLSSCGYTTIYSKNNQNINVEVLSFSGDKRINYRLIQKLENNKNSNSESIKIKINTDYEKKEVSKNSAGKILNFELKANINFEVSIKDKNSKFSISENFMIENFDDEFLELNYENKIKDNMVETIYQRLIIQLIRLQ